MTATTTPDRVPRDAPGCKEIAFSVPEIYNAGDILFANLARGRGDHAAVVGPLGAKTYRQLCADASQMAHVLLGLGLSRGDRVLLFLDDTPVYPAALFGAIRAGLVPVLINTQTPSALLNFYLSDAGATVAVVDAAFLDRFDAAGCEGTRLAHILVANGAVPETGHPGCRSLDASLAPAPTTIPAADTHRDAMAFWQYSSGSTGRPKGIVHLQHDMAYTVASFARHILALGPDAVCLSVPKIFFAYGLGNSLIFPFAAGATSVLLPGQPKAASVLQAIAHYRPTHFFGLPTLYTSLVKAPEAGVTDLSSLRLCYSAAEVLANEVADAWRHVSGRDIVEGLGSTEVLHVYLSNTREDRRPGAAGRRVPGYEIALRDFEGRDVADGEEGILWVRGDSNAPCYWNRPEKTAETMRDDGWIYTGDRMVRDGDGFHFFRGRADDLVKVSGQWVYPLEVELCLADHPLVHECAVIAVEMEDRRMTLKAFVVLEAGHPDRDATTRVLQDHVKQVLLPHKYPRIVDYRDALPKTGTGKIDRQALLKPLDPA